MWSKESIRTLLNTNDKAVARAILALYSRQTADEQQSENTKHQNNIGFNAFDSKIMSSFAKTLHTKKILSEKQIACSRKLLQKYAGQLASIANEKMVG